MVPDTWYMISECVLKKTFKAQLVKQPLMISVIVKGQALSYLLGSDSEAERDGFSGATASRNPSFQ